MRIHELIVETAEEDRAIMSLADVIYDYLQKYADTELDYDETGVIHIGRIGDLFDTPIPAIDRIRLAISTDEAIVDLARRLHGKATSEDSHLGEWDPGEKAISLNADYLSTNRMRTIIAHELRHAMDDIKSSDRANQSTRYSTARNPADQEDPDTAYRAQPAEINARFIEALHFVAPIIPKLANLDPAAFRTKMTAYLNRAFEVKQIADIYPEKTDNPHYKRLLQRAWDFINKELAHVKSKTVDTPAV
jgi:hypothetical protein